MRFRRKANGPAAAKYETAIVEYLQLSLSSSQYVMLAAVRDRAVSRRMTLLKEKKRELRHELDFLGDEAIEHTPRQLLGELLLGGHLAQIHTCLLKSVRDQILPQIPRVRKRNDTYRPIPGTDLQSVVTKKTGGSTLIADHPAGWLRDFFLRVRVRRVTVQKMPGIHPVKRQVHDEGVARLRCSS